MPRFDNIDGFETLEKRLKALGPAVGGKILRAAVRSAMLPAKTAAKARIPVSDRTYLTKTYKGRRVAPGFARRNIAIRTWLARDKASAIADLGVRAEAFYAVQFIETGWGPQRRQPWLEPAFRRNRGAMLARMRKRLLERIRKASRS